jgi:tetratricopeptide (TPR) repeat protein
MDTSEIYLQSLKKLNLNEIMKLYLNIEGVKKADEGNFDKALEYFSKAIELSPKDTISYFNRASVKMYLGEINGAKSDLKKIGSSELRKILKWVYHIILIFIIIILFL